MQIQNFKIKTECSLCPTKIWEYNGIKLKKTSEYHEATVKMDNLSQMKIGVCAAHSKIKKSDLPIIEAKTKQGWLEEVALGIGNEDWVKKTGSKLKVVGV